MFLTWDLGEYVNFVARFRTDLFRTDFTRICFAQILHGFVSHRFYTDLFRTDFTQILCTDFTQKYFPAEYAYEPLISAESVPHGDSPKPSILIRVIRVIRVPKNPSHPN